MGKAQFNPLFYTRVATFAAKNESESVRNKEIEFYSKLDDWWGPNCPQAQLHKFNEVRVNFVRRNILQQHKNKMG